MAAQTITVPDLVGLTKATAEAKLNGVGLVVGTVTTANSAKIPSGSVSSANPASGTAVNSGSAVNLEVSGGPAHVAVPDLVGLTQSAAEAKLKSVGLTVGTVTIASSATIPVGTVSNANPAAGTPVSSGSAVNLEVGGVAVPNVVGLTRAVAEAKLKGAHLVVGAVKTRPSNSVPVDAINSTDPDPDTLVSPGSAVELELSTGPKGLTQYLPTALFATLGIVLLSVIVFIVTTESGRLFLEILSRAEVARGLITFLIAIGTVGIAIILAISTLVLTEGDAGDKRFDRGKQVLSVLIGVLGTIVGFYFGSAQDTGGKQKAPAAITTKSLPDGKVGTAYPTTTLKTTGLTLPLKWSVTPPKVPDGLVFDDVAGTISGTPTKVFPKDTFTFTATDSSDPPASPPVAKLTLEIKQ